MSAERYDWGMASHVHQAIAQVRAIHRHMIEKQRFKGYSGRARAFSGSVALLGSIWLAQHPAVSLWYRLELWSVVAGVALATNYGAVIAWFLGDPAGERRASQLKPLIEVFPALAVGAVLTVVFCRDGEFGYFPGMWMAIYGLANWSSRHCVPPGIAWIGLYYLLAGVFLLFRPGVGLANPWPMGLVFFVGEWAAGWLIHADDRHRASWRGFLGLGSAAPENAEG